MRKQSSAQRIKVKTMSGEIEYTRDYYYCRECKHGESPLDEMLGIGGQPHKITKKLMEEIAFYGQNQSSFDGARLMLRKALDLDINEETIREVTEQIGKEIFKQDTRNAKATLANIHKIGDGPKIDSVLYIMIDGAAVNTRVEDENGSTWRENKTVLVFRERDMVKRKNGGHIITKKEYMPYIGSSEDFKAYVLDTAVRAGYGRFKETVIIADGATWIRNMCEEIFPDAVQILDLYHLKENIYTYAKHKYNHDSAKYTAWAESAIAKVEKGLAEELLSELPETEKLPAGIVNLKTYITNNRDKINYPEYKEKGYFVGSGAIESANKLIVQRRLKQAGMRWSVEGAQALLSLRAKVESGLWDQAMQSRSA